MIDFSLSAHQAQVVQNARQFARTVLKDARSKYTAIPNGPGRFQSTKPILEQATALGLVKGLVPPGLGGAGGSLVDSCLAVEELYAVEPSVALTLLAIGLGLTPLIMGGSPQQQEKFIAPFLTTTGCPLASLVFSEPGGSANYFELGSKGMQTTAVYDELQDEWIISGEKIWATNCAGWDFKGADLQCVVCRSINPEHAEIAHTDTAMILIVTRADVERNKADAFTVLRHPETPGHTATSGPHIRYSELRVPAFNLLSPPGSIATKNLISAAFTSTAACVGAMSVGIMRAAFECAYEFAKSHDAGGSIRLLERQSVADLLIDIKMRVEVARTMSWKAAHVVQNQYQGAEELAHEAKIWCSEAAVRSCADAMRLVGVSSYSEDYPLHTYMADALVLPIFDSGNIGLRRRHIQNIFLNEDYDPWVASLGAVDSLGQNHEG